MNAWKVIGYDAVLHLGSYVVLSILLLILVRVIERSKIRIALFSAFFTILLVGLSTSLLKGKLLSTLPEGSDLIATGMAATATACIACLFIKWRMRASFLASGCSAALIIVAHFCSSTFTPILSKQLMPEGPRFAEIGSHTKSEIKRIVDDAIKKQEETGTPSLIAKLGESYKGFKKITTEEESKRIGQEFKAGMKFIQERRALMSAMSNEEKEAYRTEMAAFKEEHGIQNDPYSAESLARLKNVKGMEGIAGKLEAAALMKESLAPGMSGLPTQGKTQALRSTQAQSMSLDELGDMMGALTAGLSSVDSSEFATDSATHGNELADMGEMVGALGSVANIMGGSELNLSAMNPAGLMTTPGAPTGPYPTVEIDRPVYQNFMVKDSAPDQNYFAPSPDQSETTTDLELEVLPTEELELEVAALEEEIDQGPQMELVDPDSLIPTTTEKGIFRIPDDDELWDEWLAAAEAVKVEGFFVGEGIDSTTIVIIGNQAVTLGEISEIKKGGKTYAFRVDTVDEGVVRLSAVGRS